MNISKAAFLIFLSCLAHSVYAQGIIEDAETHGDTQPAFVDEHAVHVLLQMRKGGVPVDIQGQVNRADPKLSVFVEDLAQNFSKLAKLKGKYTRILIEGPIPFVSEGEVAPAPYIFEDLDASNHTAIVDYRSSVESIVEFLNTRGLELIKIDELRIKAQKKLGLDQRLEGGNLKGWISMDQKKISVAEASAALSNLEEAAKKLPDQKLPAHVRRIRLNAPETKITLATEYVEIQSSAGVDEIRELLVQAEQVFR